MGPGLTSPGTEGQHLGLDASRKSGSGVQRGSSLAAPGPMPGLHDPRPLLSLSVVLGWGWSRPGNEDSIWDPTESGLQEPFYRNLPTQNLDDLSLNHNLNCLIQDCKLSAASAFRLEGPVFSARLGPARPTPPGLLISKHRARATCLKAHLQVRPDTLQPFIGLLCRGPDTQIGFSSSAI